MKDYYQRWMLDLFYPGLCLVLSVCLAVLGWVADKKITELSATVQTQATELQLVKQAYDDTERERNECSGYLFVCEDKLALCEETKP